VVTGPTDEQLRFTGTPLLVIEVLSTNRSHDLVTKYRKYAQAGLPRYWVVDFDGEKVTAYSLRAGVYEEVATVSGTDAAEWDFGAGTVHIRPSELFA
jgi:Uma2 family endonuclease